mmetsp:Transcript_6838/g.15776  ORF Transcript_6838/g.15776 Transcript_6838/m.15776 type:complete len:209 (-) Transcript_6838:146-772(-)
MTSDMDCRVGTRSPFIPSALLAAGQCFSGTQNVTTAASLHSSEYWDVVVRILECDPKNSTLCGDMEALNVPSTEAPVTTFWEGEIIDNINSTFITKRWEATRKSDLEYWGTFPQFAPLREAVERDGGVNLDLSQLPCVFMRWKELFFLDAGMDCGLTISGFYYVCFNRGNGEISGEYYDPKSQPHQKLNLTISTEGRSGYSFAGFEFR